MGKFTPDLLFWYVFPVVVLVAANYAVTALSLQKRWRLKAPDLTIPFLFLGIRRLSISTYGESVLPYFLITAIFMAIGVVLYQAYYYGEINYGHYFKMIWRLLFILTMVLYLVLMVANIASFV